MNLLGFALRPGMVWRSTIGAWRRPGARCRENWCTPVRAYATRRSSCGGGSRAACRAVSNRRWPIPCSLRSAISTTAMSPAPRVAKIRAVRPNELAEIWRLLGSLELLDVSRKIELGDMLVALLPKRKLANLQGPMIWTLGRLGQRVPVYGPLNTVVPSETVERWLDELLHHTPRRPGHRRAGRHANSPSHGGSLSRHLRQVPARSGRLAGRSGGTIASDRTGAQRRPIGHGRTASGLRRIAAEGTAAGIARRHLLWFRQRQLVDVDRSRSAARDSVPRFPCGG